MNNNVDLTSSLFLSRYEHLQQQQLLLLLQCLLTVTLTDSQDTKELAATMTDGGTLSPSMDHWSRAKGGAAAAAAAAWQECTGTPRTFQVQTDRQVGLQRHPTSKVTRYYYLFIYLFIYFFLPKLTTVSNAVITVSASITSCSLRLVQIRDQKLSIYLPAAVSALATTTTTTIPPAYLSIENKLKGALPLHLSPSLDRGRGEKTLKR